MDWMKELHIAAENNQKVTLKLVSGEKITGATEMSSDSERVKIRTVEGPVWVPYTEVQHVSRVINLFH